MLTGNRGILHDGRTLGARRWTHPHWISCTLDWKGTRRTPMSPGTWTELFFLDEAVALAAGHRPCALCRRPAFRAFQVAWGGAPAPEIDRALHAARVTPGRSQRRHLAPAADLPDGSMILWQDRAHLCQGGRALPFAAAGYGPPVPLPQGPVTVLTPAPVIAVLRAGYRPVLHPTARGDRQT
jgi:hypothetical protein